MVKSAESVVIARPAAKVFQYVADLRNEPNWHVDIAAVRPGTDPVPVVGKTYALKFKPFMGKTDGTFTALDVEPGARVEYRADFASCSSSRIRFLASELGGFLLRHTGTGAVLDVGLLEPVVQGCFGDPEVFGDLRDWGFVLPCHGDYVPTELSGERLRHVNILAARTKSSQVRSQANPGHSPRRWPRGT